MPRSASTIVGSPSLQVAFGLAAVITLMAGVAEHPNVVQGDAVIQGKLESGVSAGETGIKPTTSATRPVAQFQKELLYIAFEAASAIPVQPHVKDRSRMQAMVASAWIELGQPERALRCADDIVDWHRGVVFAEVAQFAARNADKSGESNPIDVDQLLEQAIQISNGVEDWRRDQIKSKVAGAYALRGEIEKSLAADAGLVASEMGKADEARADSLKSEDFDEFSAKLDSVIALAHFDRTRSALNAYVRLLDRFYGDKERRSVIDGKIRQSMQKLPVIIRVDMMMRMSAISMGHGDREAALAVVNEGQAIMESYEWAIEDRVPLMAKVAKARHGAGDFEKARADAHAALEAYLADNEKILKVFRAEALRPLAEAYQAMGDHKAALDVFKIAVEDGADNVNARPRALDLTATCVSMALRGIEPDEALWSRIREVRNGLDHPW